MDLLSLPPELVKIIIGYLDVYEILKIRSCCKRYYNEKILSLRRDQLNENITGLLISPRAIFHHPFFCYLFVGHVPIEVIKDKIPPGVELFQRKIIMNEKGIPFKYLISSNDVRLWIDYEVTNGLKFQTRSRALNIIDKNKSSLLYKYIEYSTEPYNNSIFYYVEVVNGRLIDVDSVGI